MNKENIKTTDWLTRGTSKEQLEQEKQEAIMSADLAMCHIEGNYCGEIYTDYNATAQNMIAKGYRKATDVAKEIFEKLYANIKFDGHTVSVWKNDLIEVAKEYGISLE